VGQKIQANLSKMFKHIFLIALFIIILIIYPPTAEGQVDVEVAVSRLLKLLKMILHMWILIIMSPFPLHKSPSCSHLLTNKWILIYLLILCHFSVSRGSNPASPFPVFPLVHAAMSCLVEGPVLPIFFVYVTERTIPNNNQHYDDDDNHVWVIVKINILCWNTILFYTHWFYKFERVRIKTITFSIWTSVLFNICIITNIIIKWLD
jgi:hypothetical protein